MTRLRSRPLSGYCTESIRRDGRYHQRACSRIAKYDPDEFGVPTKCGSHSNRTKERKAEKETT